MSNNTRVAIVTGAATVAMLVSDAASFVTGQILYVNGGGPA